MNMKLEAALILLREEPKSTAVLTDFDGTLASLVDDPKDARPLQDAIEVLSDLVTRCALVGVVSGRPVTFLATHLEIPGLWLSGLYGLESMEDGEIIVVSEALEWREVVSEVVHAAIEALPGLLIEDKGISMTVHFRTASERETEVRNWVKEIAISSGLEMRDAKASIELHPPIAGDKGSVIEEKILGSPGIKTVCFLGDDRGDLPAFAGLSRLSDQGLRTIRVGVQTPETPALLLNQADILVEGPTGALEFLRELTTQ